MTPEFQRILQKKVNAIETMPLSTLYKQDSVKNNNYQLYKEAIGTITQDDKMRYQQQVSKQYVPVTQEKMADDVFEHLVSRVAPESPERDHSYRPRIESGTTGYSQYNTPHRAVSTNSLILPPNVKDYPNYSQKNTEVAARKGRFEEARVAQPPQSSSLDYSTVKFSVNYETNFGQELWFVGSAAFCGNW